MSTALKLSDDLVNKAKIRAKTLNRSTTGQIEHWAKVGRIAEENPDLNYAFIQAILLSMEEVNAGEIEAYVFGEGDKLES